MPHWTHNCAAELTFGFPKGLAPKYTSNTPLSEARRLAASASPAPFDTSATATAQASGPNHLSRTPHFRPSFSE